MTNLPQQSRGARPAHPCRHCGGTPLHRRRSLLPVFSLRRYHVCSTASLRNRSARPHRPQPATSLSPALNCRGSSSGRCPRFDPAVEPATPEAVVHHIDSEQTLTAPIQQLQRARDRSAVARFFPVAEPQMSGLCFPTRSTSGCPRAGSKVASSISAVDNGLPMRSHRCAAIFSCPSPPDLSPAPATCTGENASPLCGHFPGTHVPACRFQGGQLHLSGGQRPPSAIARVRGRLQPCCSRCPRPPATPGPRARARDCVATLRPLSRHLRARGQVPR